MLVICNNLKIYTYYYFQKQEKEIFDEISKYYSLFHLFLNKFLSKTFIVWIIFILFKKWFVLVIKTGNG